METKDMVGRTFSSVTKASDDELIFTEQDGRVWRFHHEQDCCEDVRIEDICGDLDDLVGFPLVEADESTEDYEQASDDSGTWTFYRFSTVKGTVTVRWIGESNGYYSESVDLEVKEPEVKES